MTAICPTVSPRTPPRSRSKSPSPIFAIFPFAYCRSSFPQSVDFSRPLDRREGKRPRTQFRIQIEKTAKRRAQRLHLRRQGFSYLRQIIGVGCFHLRQNVLGSLEAINLLMRISDHYLRRLLRREYGGNS